MRDTRLYPVTADECIEAVIEAKRTELAKNQIGGIQPMALSFVEEYLTKNRKFREWLEKRQS